MKALISTLCKYLTELVQSLRFDLDADPFVEASGDLGRIRPVATAHVQEAVTLEGPQSPQLLDAPGDAGRAIPFGPAEAEWAIRIEQEHLHRRRGGDHCFTVRSRCPPPLRGVQSYFGCAGRP